LGWFQAIATAFRLPKTVAATYFSSPQKAFSFGNGSKTAEFPVNDASLGSATAA